MHRTAIITILLGLAGWPASASCEVIELANGGQLNATPVHDSERAKVNQVELEVGQFGTVIVNKDQIRRVESPQVSEDDYFEQASKFADTTHEA